MDYVWLAFLALLPVALAVLQGLFTRIKARCAGIKLQGQNIFITGGSKGLGRAFASLCASSGANVTIVARDLAALEEAKTEILSHAKGQVKVLALSANVTDEASIASAVATSEQTFGPIDILVTCAGAAKPGYITEQPSSLFRSQMDLNYFGVVHTVKPVLAGMTKRRSGRIVIVTSAMALTGFTGYSQYCATKFALRGFSDCLRNELAPYNIKVHLFLPSNMDTPGFEEENKTKPEDTREIEGLSKPISAQQSALDLLTGLNRGYYQITQEFLIDLMLVGSASVTPRGNVWFDVLLAPLIPIVAVILTKVWDSTASRVYKKRCLALSSQCSSN
eukprot:GILK01005941.1.p1 GENE.GILK01005941.1~~GILK01005941.1.p1  ORF type:complete len:343 (+),score=35.47 GILK01005941.1:29-1030(+)